MRKNYCLPLFIAISCALFGPGCAATRFSAGERLATVSVDETVVDSFHVEDLRCEVKMEARDGTSPVRIPKSSVNRLLEERFPRSFDRSWQSVPLHVVCSGTIPVSPMEKADWGLFNCAASLLFYRHADRGLLRIELKVGGEAEDVQATVGYSRSHSFSFPSPLAAVIPGKGDWRAIRSIHPTGDDCEEALADLVAAGIVKALNGMDAQQRASLRSQRHLTEGQRAALASLSAGSPTTVSIRETEAGTVYVEAKNKYEVSPVDAAERLRQPTIVEQRYDAESRIGVVVADVTGCEPQRAEDYLVGRLVPAICRTKNVVFSLSDGPSAGGTFKILEDHTEINHVRTIRFQAIQ